MTATLNVALCLDENYVEPARTLIETLRAHHEHGRLAIWLLHEDLNDGSLRQLEAQCGGWASIRSLRIETDLGSYFGADRGWLPYQNKSVLYRILLPRLLFNAGIKRALYLDCDILCVGSLAAVTHLSLDGKVLGAVQDAFTPRLSSNDGIPNYHPRVDDDYFNSGVLLIDTERWVARDVESRALSYLASTRGNQRFFDQDALNVACVGDWLQLHASFNTMITDPFEQDLMGALELSRLIHFVGPHKPWHNDYHPGNRRAMYEMYRSAWRKRERAT